MILLVASGERTRLRLRRAVPGRWNRIFSRTGLRPWVHADVDDEVNAGIRRGGEDTVAGGAGRGERAPAAIAAF